MPSVTNWVPHIHSTSAEGDGGEGVFRPFYTFVLVLVLGLARASPALALFKKKKKKADTIDEYSSRLVKLYWPIMANLGFSGAVGLATGLALRVVHLCRALQLNSWHPTDVSAWPALTWHEKDRGYHQAFVGHHHHYSPPQDPTAPWPPLCMT